jgi:ubiquinol-cytochrome c reductase cytochrome b subunit
VSRLQRVVTSARRRVDALASKVFPGHWSFMLGEVALFSFLVLVLTGLYLAWFYEASGETVVYDGSHEAMAGVEMSRAYASVLGITFDRPAGALMRQTHHWAAVVFVAAIVLHAMRIFFTGAFRRPRRLNWTIGVTLMGLAMVAGFFGLALPHDLLGGTGARIGHAFSVSIPVVGPGVADLLFAGDFGNPDMLHRFWLLHVVILPILIAGLLGGHLALVFLQSHTQFADRSATTEGTSEPTPRRREDTSPRRRDDNVVGAAAWPGYLLKATGLTFVVAGVLVTLGAAVQIAPIWLYGPFDPSAATVPAQPDWYLGWVEGALRILPSLEVQVAGREIPSPFFTGVLLPVAVFAVLYAWPFLEAAATGDHEKHHLLDRPREHPVRTGLGVAGLAALGVLLLAGSHDLQALLLRVPVDSMTWAYRWLLVLVPPTAGLLAYGICRSLVRGEREGRGQPDSGDEQRPREPVGVG